ncbi:ice-binding family protein [Aeromicrobium sp. CF4.19]|uniref:ice-binding family protein n=1 Tax=Aeromicrobium sp. CF4.19 TaxID=3373082 RepID=UPI003EE8067E
MSKTSDCPADLVGLLGGSMTSTRTPHDLRRLKPLVACVGAAALIAMTASFGGDARAADASTPVELGTADQFGVLAYSAITNTDTVLDRTRIEGDIGVSEPPSPITGIDDEQNLVPPSQNRGGDAVTQEAKLDLDTAYEEAALAEGESIGAELAGERLVGGVYEAPVSFLLSNGTLTLDGGNTDGSPSNSVFIFQTSETLTTIGTNSGVALTGGAQACNVFWQVGSSATFGTGTGTGTAPFVGTVMAQASITAQTGATFEGRLLAIDGAVTLDTNTITRPEPCVRDADDGDTDTVGDDTDTDGTDTDGTDTDGTDTDADADGGVADADGDVGDADADGTDGDGTDADGTDADAGADADAGTDVDADGTDAGADADARADAAGSDVDADVTSADGADADGTSVDGGTSTGGSTPGGWLPEAGGPSLILIVAGALVALAGAGILLARRLSPRRH